MIKLITFLLAVLIDSGAGQTSWHPCNGTDEISISYEPGKPPGEENQYYVLINIKIPQSSSIEMQFDSEASVTLSNSTAGSARLLINDDIFTMRFFRPAETISFQVRGPPSGTVPYLKYLKINTQEYCKNSNVGYLDQYITGYKYTDSTQVKVPKGCGRRKMVYTELIVSGEATKAGDWPWHVAIYRLDRSSFRYICGGTLISKTLVLTAAHCVAIRGAPVTPEILSVVLGKHNLIGGDIESQEREVYSVIVHENFKPKNYLENDIALLKLKTEANYNDYVQPACIWYEAAYNRLPTGRVFGTVVGWGFDQSSSLSAQLRQANMPKVSEATCIKKNPLFYSTVLGNDKKFCAGWANGTSACNGDSGGGFLVFVPDTSKDNSANAAGSWHVRGIVSLSPPRSGEAICDSYQYVVFTDVAKYTGWIQRHMDN